MFLSHIFFFADDAVFIGEWSLDNAIIIIGILMCFKKASGLQVNYQKSRVFGIGADSVSVGNMANLLGCKADKLPTMFLGIPIGSHMKRAENWQPIIEKFRKKLSIWKAKTLSIGGRLTIVSNILGGIPNYWMSMFPVPKNVASELEKMRRDFFWGPKDSGKPIPWVKWSIACQQKHNGGLGIIGIEDMNTSLLAKWIWRVKHEEKAIWVQVIKSIHGENAILTEDKTRRVHPCSWKNIILKIQKLNPAFLNISNLLQVKLGDGGSTKFWEDKWSEEGSLRISFPRMYALEEEKECLAKDRLNTDFEAWKRRRDIRDGREREEANRLKLILDRASLNNDADKWIVPGAPNDSFSTSWLRDCLETFKTMGKTQQDFWHRWILKKHNVFIWRYIRNRIPTRKLVSDMGIDIQCTLCPLCELKEEDNLHLFFECEFSRSLWLKFGDWWKVQIPTFNRAEDPLVWASYVFQKKYECSRLQVAVIALLVSIWKTRNGVIFDKKKAEKVRVFRNIIELAYFWLAYFWLFSRNSRFKVEMKNWTLNPKIM